MKRFFYMLLLAVISMTVVSCDEREWWDTPHITDDVVGSWESYYEFDGYEEFDIWGSDVMRYDFYRDLTGRYTFFSAGRYYYIDFLWRTDGNRLQIWYDDGLIENMYYSFDLNGDLIVSSSRYFNQYIAYRPVGFYFKQGESLDPIKAESLDHTTDVRSMTATMKAKD